MSLGGSIVPVERQIPENQLTATCAGGFSSQRTIRYIQPVRIQTLIAAEGQSIIESRG